MQLKVRLWFFLVEEQCSNSDLVWAASRTHQREIGVKYSRMFSRNVYCGALGSHKAFI